MKVKDLSEKDNGATISIKQAKNSRLIGKSAKFIFDRNTAFAIIEINGQKQGVQLNLEDEIEVIKGGAKHNE